MAELADAHIRGWRDGEERDMAQEMMSLTLDIAVRTLFGTTLAGEAQQVGRAMTFLMRYSLARQRSPMRIPRNVADAEQPPRDSRTANSSIRSSTGSSTSGRPNGRSSQHEDLLSMLMGAMDEDGSQMTPKQLRDEAMTLSSPATRPRRKCWRGHGIC